MKKPTKKKLKRTYDVAIIGAGLAGLSLARQLLLNTDKKILLIEKRAQNPAKRQKYGESLVQVGGYYFGKVLDLEEHLFCEHYMKYNLRFYWKNARRDNDNFEDYSQAYIRPFSNIPCYQIDRNKLEGELLRLNQENPNFTFCAPATELKVSLQDEGPHRVAFEFEEIQRRVKATWVVDTSGRSKFLARQLGLDQPSAIDHGSSFFLGRRFGRYRTANGAVVKGPASQERSPGHRPFALLAGDQSFYGGRTVVLGHPAARPYQPRSSLRQ